MDGSLNRRMGALFVLGLIALTACSNRPEREDDGADFGDPCLSASDCGDGLICGLIDPVIGNICTRDCLSADADCGPGATCMSNAYGAFCVPDELSANNSDSNNANNANNNGENNGENNADPNNSDNNSAPNNTVNNADPGNNANNTQDGTCLEDAECEAGEICDSRRCAPGCRDDEGCASDEICERGSCTPGCRSDEDCSEGEVCEGVSCTPGCRTDAECEEGEVCDAQACVPDPTRCVPDSYEPSDSSEEAASITPGTLQATACAGDEDWYALNTNARDTLTLSLAFLHAEGDLGLAVLDGSGAQLGSSYGGSNNERLTLTSPGGALLIRVTTAREAGGSSYTLTSAVQPPAVNLCNDPFEPNNTRDAAVAIQPGNHTGLGVCADDREDWFALTLGALDTVSVEVFFSDADSDIDLLLQSATGTTIDSSASVTDNELVEGEVPTAGTYYVRVYNYGGAEAAYSMNIAVIPGPDPPSCEGDPFEPNDDAPTTLDATLADAALCEGDVDLYAVTVDEPDTILTFTASFDGRFGAVDLELFGLDGTTSLGDASAGTASTTLEVQVPTAGVYTLAATLGEGVAVVYDLAVTQRPAPRCTDAYEPNNTIEMAVALGSGTYPDLAVCPTADVNDYYSFSALGGTDATITIRFIDATADIDLAILNDAGTTLRSSTSTTDDESITFEIPEDGVYFIRVYHYSGAPNSYDLTLEATPLDLDCAEVDLEPNNTPAEAVSVAPGSHSGTLCPVNPDLYAIEVFSGLALTATLTFDTAEGDLALDLLDSDGTTLLATSNTATGREFIGRNINADGTLYIRVRGTRSRGALYNLELVLTDERIALPCEDLFEPNNTLDAALPLSPGSFPGLDLCTSEDLNDYYAFTIAMDQVLTVDILFSDDDADLDLAILDEDGTFITSSTSVTDNEHIAWTATYTGTVLVRAYVYSNSGDAGYTLNVSVE